MRARGPLGDEKRATTTRRGRWGSRLVTAAAAGGAVVLLAAAGPSCMLITSPGDFTVVDLPDATAADAPVCAVESEASECVVCLQKRCCATYSACNADAACVALANCDADDASCMKDNASGAKLVDALVACGKTSCAICTEAGIGDRCGVEDVDCVKGIQCLEKGLWCTALCSQDGDCQGIGSQGENGAGNQNRCALNAEGNAYCFPGCGSASDCAAFADTSCVEATAPSGETTKICAPDEGDAGTDSGSGFDSGLEPEDAATDAGGADGSADAQRADASRDARPTDAQRGDARTDAHGRDGSTPTDSAPTDSPRAD